MIAIILLLLLSFTSPTFAEDVVGIDWQDDPRLGSGVTPWNSAAAAALYCGTGPIRAYLPGDFICSDIDVTVSPDVVVHKVWQVNSVYSTNSPSLATIMFPRVNCAQLVASPSRVRYIFETNVPGATATAQTLNTSLLSVTPSCSDNVWNGDETGIDCGGSCNPCAAPGVAAYPPEAISNFWSMASILVGGFCALVFALSFYPREVSA